MFFDLKWSVILLYFYIVIYPSYQNKINTHRLYDDMGSADKMRIENITEEIVKEAHMKMRQIAGIRDAHCYTTAFDIGIIMGNIREKYRRMLETYREYRDKRSNRSIFFPPSIHVKFYPIYYIMAMENVHAIEKDIDKLVHVFESLDNEALNPDPRYLYRSTTQGRGLRSKDFAIIRRMAEEQELKSRIRETHLLKRLGQPTGQHTTSKRFLHRWPVDKNWDLGPYGDFGLYS